MIKKTIRLTAFLMAAGMLTTGCGASKKNEESSLPKANVFEFSKKNMSETLEVEGVVESSEKDSTLTTELIDCKVSSVKVSVGDKVKAGDVLIELDSSEIQQEISELEKLVSDSDTLYDFRFNQLQKQLENTKKSGNLDISEAEKKLNDLRDEYNNLNTEYNNQVSRYNTLIGEANDIRAKAEGASDEMEAASLMAEYEAKMTEAAGALQAYESANAQMKSINESIPLAEKSLEATKIAVASNIDNVQYEIDTYSLTANSSSDNTKKLDELKSKLEKTIIKATRDGVVSSVLAEEGKVCSGGILMTLQNTSDMCVHVSISETDLLSVESGMNVVISIPARKENEYSGVVDRVLEIKNTNGFDSYISIDDTTDFRIGMTANVKIKTIEADDVLCVNKKSVFTDEESGKKYVYEAEKQSEDSYKLRKVEVTEGVSGESLVQITGDGLEEGDYIVSAPGKFKEDDIVSVRVSR